MVAPAVDVKNHATTLSDDGRRHTNPGRWALIEPFNVSVVAAGTLSAPAYRIKPPAGSWGTWIDGQNEALSGNITAVWGTQLAGPFAFADATNAVVSTIIESNAIAISAEGHELQVRRQSALEADTMRSLTVNIGGASTEWRIYTASGASPPAEGSPDPTPVDPDGVGHFVASTTSIFDGSGVSPGDTITIASGTRGPLRFNNVEGTALRPVLIRNDPSGSGPVVMRRASAGTGDFIFQFRDCKHVIVDGLFKWVGAGTGVTYGLQSKSTVAGDRPTSYVRILATSSDMKFRGVLAEGVEVYTGGSATPIGFSLGDSTLKTNRASPTNWRENITFEFCRAYRTTGEGWYIGENYPSSGDIPWPLRNIHIKYCEAHDCGREGIQTKMTLQGTNSIHGCDVRRTGMNDVNRSDQGSGISVTEGGSNYSIYNNYVENAGIHGLHHRNAVLENTYGPFTMSYYNNVVYNSGVNPGATGNGRGASIGAAASKAQVTPTVYNNTIALCGSHGISFDNTSGNVARDNIITDAPTYLSGVTTNTNNRTGTTAAQNFVDADAQNFRLTSTSPARDSGSVSGYPATDFDGVARPQGSAADQGAFEYEAP